MSKFASRCRILLRAIPRLPGKFLRRRPPQQVKRILVAHNLLLGDTVMLSPLLHKLRAAYPAAEITLLCKKPFLDLFRLNPLNIKVMPWQLNDTASVSAVIRSGPWDLAFIPGDNRYAWLTLAAGTRWIVAHNASEKTFHHLAIDDRRDYPTAPQAWSDAIAGLTPGDMPAALPWRASGATPLREDKYVVLHVGASNPTRFWPAERWFELACWLESEGYSPVWSGIESERKWVDAADPQGRFTSYAGRLTLAELLELLRGAGCLICADTGVAHVAKLSATPTITLYGPGNPVAFGAGEYWAGHPVVNAGFNPIACRDQNTLFSRELPWLARCGRTEKTCLHFTNGCSACMASISVEDVKDAFRKIKGIDDAPEFCR